MRFTPTLIPQLYVLDLESRVDERGFFARVWCQQELAELGLSGQCVQASIAYNTRRGTLRGMHYQQPPHLEDKYIRVTRGSIWDVVLDLRQDSPAYGRWFATELSADDRRAVFVPRGCAHGYLTLADDTEVLYMMSSAYQREGARGIRWSAEALRGAWPFSPVVVSVQDSQWPEYLVPLSVADEEAPAKLAG